MAKQAQQQMTAEETLARLSDQVKFTLNFTVEPMPDPKPKPKPKLKKKGKLGLAVRSHYRGLVESSTRRDIPTYRVTGTTMILGRVLRESYEGILPDNVKSTQNEIQNRLYWYIRNIYMSKSIATGSHSIECVVDLQP